MFGKHFASMYSGSMVGSGALVFALMGYVVANMKPDSEVGMQVEMNPDILGTVFGEPVKSVEAAIKKLCSPDPKSRSKEEDGRRLVQVGQYDYRVVNGPKYAAIRDEEGRREYNRKAKQKERAKRKYPSSGKPLPGEIAYVRAVNDGADPDHEPCGS